MLIYDAPALVNAWVSSKGGGRANDGFCTALGWLKDNELTAGLVFHDANGVNCSVNIALDGKVFPPTLLKAGLRYVFLQLQLKRLTFIISEANIASQRLCAQLGAIHEATLRDADINGNLLIYALFPANCKIWSRLNGKRRGRTAPGT